MGDFRIQWGVKIGLRDGVELNATLYLPSDDALPAPALCILTPYIADTHHERGVYLASHGLPVAIVDVRGRGNSQGKFRPLIQEARDGYDVVEWLAQQSYCNGKVGMCGGSYLGYSQWATAKEFPAHLGSLIPAASPCIGVDFPMRNNIFNPYLVQWLTYTAGRTGQKTVFADAGFWAERFRRWHESGLPFRQLDRFVADTLPTFQEWLDHPTPDSYWDAYNPSADQYARLALPILTLTGIYDDNQAGALEHYRRHCAASAEGAKRHYLVIGPWDHAGAGWSGHAEFGGVKFAPASQVDLPALHCDWFAWTLGSGPRPAFLRKRVAFYVTGLEQWRYADSLDEITTTHRAYYLDSAGTANHVFGSGTLNSSPGTGRPDHYRFDPRETSGPEVVAERHLAVGSLVDQSTVLALDGRQLVYHSAPFEENTEISGFFKLSVWMAIEGVDTDFFVTVYEITADGGSIRLSTDGMRARYRESLRCAASIPSGVPLRFDFERFTFTSRRLPRGHRLRLVIAPVGRLIDTVFSQKNYQGGGTVSEESVKQAQSVTVRLLHDAQHPSVLQVPIGAGG